MAIGVLAASVAFVTPAGAAVSDADCAALFGDNNSSSGNANGSDRAALAAQASTYATMAKQVKDAKLKAALVTLSKIFKGASKAKSTTAAAFYITKRSQAYGKALAVFSKATNECLLKESVTTTG